MRNSQYRFKALRTALAFAPISITVEVLGWLFSGSLVLLADALHGFIRLVALGGSFYSLYLANRRLRSRMLFFRAEALAGIIINFSMIFVLLFMGMELANRIRYPELYKAHSYIAIIAASIAVLCNLITVYLVNRGQVKRGLRRAHRDLISLVLVTLVVLGGQLLILRFGWIWLDSAIAALIFIPVISAILGGVISNGSEILEMKGPQQDAKVVARALRQRFMAVQNVRGASIQKVGAGRYVFTAEVELPGMTLEEAEVLLDRMEEFLEENFELEQSNLRMAVYDSKTTSVK